jgi:hypothetical protein
MAKSCGRAISTASRDHRPRPLRTLVGQPDVKALFWPECIAEGLQAD